MTEDTGWLVQNARNLVEEHGPRPEWDHNYQLIDMVDRLRIALETSEDKLDEQSKYVEQLEAEKKMLDYQETAARTRYVDAESRLQAAEKLTKHWMKLANVRLTESRKTSHCPATSKRAITARGKIGGKR